MIFYLQVKCLIKEREESSPLSSGPVFGSIGKLAGGDDSQGNVGVRLALSVRCVYGHLQHSSFIKIENYQISLVVNIFCFDEK